MLLNLINTSLEAVLNYIWFSSRQEVMPWYDKKLWNVLLTSYPFYLDNPKICIDGNVNVRSS